MTRLSRFQIFLFVAGFISSVIVAFTSPDSLAYSIEAMGAPPHTALRTQSSSGFTTVGSRGFPFNQGVGSFPLIAQQGSNASAASSTPSSGDISNVLTGLIVVLILPLFWGPTRKAVGLLNIIVGTVLTITGIGAIFGIPMILIGGVCLFV